jgi:hypothetical protein
LSSECVPLVPYMSAVCLDSRAVVGQLALQQHKTHSVSGPSRDVLSLAQKDDTREESEMGVVRYRPFMKIRRYVLQRPCLLL